MYNAAIKYKHTRPVFLLSITWGSRDYHFSTSPIDVTNGDNTISYNGQLQTPDFTQQLQRYTFNVEADSVPFGVVMPIDVVEQMANGNFIDGADAEFSYVLQSVKNGEILTVFDNRVILYRGFVSEPVYGHIDQPIGYIEFSLESKAIIQKVSLLDMICGFYNRIDDADLSNIGKLPGSAFAPVVSGDVINVADLHYGKRAPFVFGKSNVAYRRATMATITTTLSPVYVIAIKSTAPTIPMFLLIAGHPVEASTITIKDNKGNTDTATISHFVGANGDIFAYCVIEFATTTLQSAIADNTVEYYGCWNYGGAYPSPYRSGPLEGGGDLCLWILSQSTNQIDFDKWLSVTPLLNRYKFAGFVNDPAFDALEFLEQHIIPFLPVAITVGPEGLTPVIDLVILGDDVTPVIDITVDNEFARVSPITTANDLSDVVNELDFNFCRNIKNDNYLSNVTITPVKDPNDVRGPRSFVFSDDYATTSNNLYGRRSLSMTADYVYDYQTAIRIARHVIRSQSLPKRNIIYNCAPRFGFLQIGDIIALTDDDLYMTNKKGQIVTKSWSGTFWEFTIEISQNKII
jgi:hypothetical protein